MTRIQELQFNRRTIRLVFLEKRWWVFCDCVAPQIKLSPAQLYAQTPGWERRILDASDSFAYLVSVNAWKIIIDAAAVHEAAGS